MELKTNLKKVLPALAQASVSRGFGTARRRWRRWWKKCASVIFGTASCRASGFQGVRPAAAHQAAALGFQGCVKTVDKKPLPAYRLFINGTDKLGAASFGEPAGVMLESDIPAFLLELGELIEFSHSTWAEWAPQNSEKLQELANRYCA